MLWGLRPAGRGCLLFGCFLCFHHLSTLFVLCFFLQSLLFKVEQKFLTTDFLVDSREHIQVESSEVVLGSLVHGACAPHHLEEVAWRRTDQRQVGPAGF